MCSQQFMYLNAGACSLEEDMSRRYIPGVVKSWKELHLSLEKFKAGLNHMMGSNIMKANFQKVWEKKGEQDCQGALYLANRFLKDLRFKYQHRDRLEALCAAVGRMVERSETEMQENCGRTSE